MDRREEIIGMGRLQERKTPHLLSETLILQRGEFLGAWREDGVRG